MGVRSFGVWALGLGIPTSTDAEVLQSRSEEHTSELQSLRNLVCRLLLEKKKNAPEDAEHPERPFRRGDGLSSPRAMWLHLELLRLVASNATRLVVEDTLTHLAHEPVACG